ncbi:polysaccharide biosynthesis tyrosine autokinase [Lentibacillus saliphilus]|uniref:polysaccharide biosynthesis tyrosine autokinase n=1 Tax=Lentibacillus saliphilus TaxID=2737028 RepID=UPI001C2FCF61|nr:polysaccharide biosynthesis tyrosine autokinase [Lentibacillus saliphilus]
MDMTLDLKALAAILFRHIWIILIIMISTVGMSLFVTYQVMSPVYEGKTELLITTEQADGQALPSPGDIDSSLKLIDTYRAIIESPTVLNPVISDLENSLTIAHLKQKMTVEPLHDSQVLVIKVEDQDQKTAVNTANLIAQSFQKRTAELMKLDNVHLLSPAEYNPDAKQICPKPVVNTIISILIGGLFAMGIVLLKHIFNTSLSSEEAVTTHLEQPVLGVIPTLPKPASEDSISSQNALRQQLMHHWQDKTPIEPYQNLAASLLYLIKNETLKTILFTSPNPGEGKSLTSLNTALLFANSKKRTLYIDMDLRKPSCHYAFQLPNHVGMSSYLFHEMPISDIIQESEIEHLSIITAGPPPPFSARLLNVAKINALLTALKDDFDIIIIDSPPTFVSDTPLISGHADGTVMVVDSKSTRYPDARQAIERITQSDSKVLGVILNNFKMKHVQDYYY